MTLSLENNALAVTLEPGVGGSVRTVVAKTPRGPVSLTRPCPPDATRSSAFASFTLAPYSNRIRDGRFLFAGRSHQLANPAKHAIHGDVRDRPWRIESAGPDCATLTLDTRAFTDFNFPFPFNARITHALDGASYRTRLVLTNTGREAMPAGGGFHTYFALDHPSGAGDSTLQFPCTGVWPAGDPPIPTGPPVPLEAALDFSEPRPIPAGLDHAFAGWTGPAMVRRPAAGIAYEVRGGETLGHLIVYSPRGESFFALEPVANATDGFNLMARGVPGTGVRVLGPGEELVMEMEITLREPF